jgi:DNA polymerase (family 10)
MAHGLDEKRLRQQMKKIDAFNSHCRGFRLLKSCEVDILEDGRLDLPDSILADLDVVTCSIHYQLNLPPAKQTERLLRAIDNPHCDIIGHPTGRLINRRPPYELDLPRIVGHARETGVCLEINSQPERLDLNDVHCRLARDVGAKLVISTDAHAPQELEYMRYGVDQARRGWLEKKNVVNTRSFEQLAKFLRRSGKAP